MRMTNSIYLVTLRKDIISPLIKESDEEGVKTEKTEPEKPAEKATGKSKKDSKTPAPEPEKPEPLKIETDGLQNRIVSLPVRAGNYSNLGVAATGEILYIVRPSEQPESSKLHKYNLKDRKDEEIMELDFYLVSADQKKMFYIKGQTYGITAAGKKPEVGKGILNTGAISVKIDPAVEWPQIFDEAWRVNRDYFYDPGMHGVDWKCNESKILGFPS